MRSAQQILANADVIAVVEFEEDDGVARRQDPHVKLATAMPAGPQS